MKFIIIQFLIFYTNRIRTKRIIFSLYNILYITIFFSSFYILGCSSSQQTIRNNEDNIERSGNSIIESALIEQQNDMYKTDSDSAEIYWTNSTINGLKNLTKCNIFALNSLFKAGYKCPDEYVLTHDLFSKNKYNDIFPVIDISSPDDILKGDLIIWNGHVIIFESLLEVGGKLYAKAIWGGSSQENNDKSVKNNVTYGKFRLEGDFIVRRPIKSY
jgi:hypothetical protein